METTHRILNRSAADLGDLPASCVALVVTSPPYPIIEMWNDSFRGQDPHIGAALDAGRLDDAFELMHQLLDRVWCSVDRLLMPGGIACVNIGDATKNDGGHFRLFSNHSRIIGAFEAMGYQLLPDIIWRKPTNAPNKFMGSGMYPPGAYVTFEHEYILIFRKGGKREFRTAAHKQNRRRSAYFWEERNHFFTDLWEFTGTGQWSAAGRPRSGAFPLEVAHRLVSMFSVQGDLVLDPFAGTMTTALACMQNARNSLSVELDGDLCSHYAVDLLTRRDFLRSQITRRLSAHSDFVVARREQGDDRWYQNVPHGFPVKTRQETELLIRDLVAVEPADGGVICRHGANPTGTT